MKKFGRFIMALAIVCMSGGIAFADLNDGLVAYYPFNGNANDESGNGNHGTVYGAILTTDRCGSANSAYSFDGANDYIQVADNDILDITSKITMAAWIYIESYTATWAPIFCKGHTHSMSSPYALLGTSNNKLEIAFNRVHLQGSSEVSINQWVHVASTWDGTKVKFYVNGVQGVQVYDYSIMLNITDENLLIGYDPPGATEWFNGKLDELYLYNRALSEAEIKELSETCPQPPCEGDFDRDGDVDGTDLAVFAADFGRTDCEAEILGTWIGDEVNGEPDSWGFIFSCNGFEVVGPQEWLRGTFLLNKTIDPYQIDSFITSSNNPAYVGQTSLGIYQIVGDTLTIAVNAPGDSSRPSSFTPDGARVFILNK